jgi:uncharacterized protein YdcH (DUF465 family)
VAVDGHAQPVFANTKERLPTEPCFRTNRLGAATSWEELPNMERNAQDEIRAHLMTSNEEFRRLANQHSEFAKKLDALESLPHLNSDQQLEETRLKKLKLRLKDQMEAIMSQYRSQQVA